LPRFLDWSFDAKVISNGLLRRRNRFFGCNSCTGSIAAARTGRENQRLPHFSKARLGTLARPARSRVVKGILPDRAKKKEEMFQEMRDPCQVEG
jgi:hypothetical protein